MLHVVCLQWRCVCVHTNLWWPCAVQEIQSTNLVALVADASHDCCSSLSAALDTCKLRHLFWEGGLENLNWIVSCLDLSKRMTFQGDGWSASSSASLGSAVPSTSLHCRPHAPVTPVPSKSVLGSNSTRLKVLQYLLVEHEHFFFLNNLVT